jgi:hypothetical protein
MPKVRGSERENRKEFKELRATPASLREALRAGVQEEPGAVYILGGEAPEEPTTRTKCLGLRNRTILLRH